MTATMSLQEAADLLERDMRAYIFDKTPDRRRMMLDRYRERLGLPTWAEAQEQQSAERIAAYEATKNDH